MSKVILGIAGVPNTSVTMFNDATEDENIANSMKHGNIDDAAKAELSVATKRLKSDGEYSQDDKDAKKRPVFVSHVDGAILFPVDEVA